MLPIVLPSLSSHHASIFRRDSSSDIEGNLSQTWVNVGEFCGGFGVPKSTRQEVIGASGQKVEAAISTQGNPDVQVGDKLNISGRDWAVIGVYDLALTKRIQLAVWGR